MNFSKISLLLKSVVFIFTVLLIHSIGNCTSETSEAGCIEHNSFLEHYGFQYPLFIIGLVTIFITILFFTEYLSNYCIKHFFNGHSQKTTYWKIILTYIWLFQAFAFFSVMFFIIYAEGNFFDVVFISLIGTLFGGALIFSIYPQVGLFLFIPFALALIVEMVQHLTKRDLGSLYTLCAGRIYYDGQLRDDIDPLSFKVLNADYARDESSIFLKGKLVESVDHQLYKKSQ